jgi:hypothetical protein
MAHSVRMVWMVAREQDLVGRLRGQQLALFLIDTAPGPVLQQRLSRLIALGLMRDAHNPAAQPIRFRLAVGLRSTPTPALTMRSSASCRPCSRRH